jgi:hypothetical protein
VATHGEETVSYPVEQHPRVLQWVETRVTGAIAQKVKNTVRKGMGAEQPNEISLVQTFR